MNKRLYFALLITLSLFSCGFSDDKEKKAMEKNGEPTASNAENTNVYVEADAWRSWAPPKELSGYKLVRFVTDPFKGQGLHSSMARYEKGELFITVQLVDGNSEKGKGEIRDHLEIAELNRDYSSDYGYEKTVVHNGIKAKEEYLAPPAGQYLIKFMLKEQYGASIKSNAETADEIWGFIDQLNLRNLR